MLTVAEMLQKTRKTIHDEKKIEYDDIELTNYLNDGNRVLRRTAMSIYPEVLVESLEGRTVKEVEDDDGYIREVATDKVVFDNPITRVLRVVVDGKTIQSIGRSEIIDHDANGSVNYYYLTGFNTINFYPKPTAPIEYRIDYIADMTLFEATLGEEGLDKKSPYPLALDDILIEYAVFRSSISDEFNMQKETTLIGTIVDQIEDVLRNMAPLCTQVEGYWNGSRPPSRRW